MTFTKIATAAMIVAFSAHAALAQATAPAAPVAPKAPVIATTPAPTAPATTTAPKGRKSGAKNCQDPRSASLLDRSQCQEPARQRAQEIPRVVHEGCNG